jgi:hypothetical protein
MLVYEAECQERIVANATFAASKTSVKSDTIEVIKPYRRKGIASLLYDLASETFELPNKPSNILSDDAKAFWVTR